MRVRTFMRAARGARSLSEVTALTGIAKGHLSMFERGHALPLDAQVPALVAVYGPVDGWYTATVDRAIHPDIRRCPGCGEELPTDAPLRRVYHDDTCRRLAARRNRCE